MTGRALAAFLIVLFAISGCQDRRFVTVGPGVALNDSAAETESLGQEQRLKRDTGDINTYLGELCKQSGERADCYETGNNPNWRLLVNTGYNDIDLRCDRYLNWIDRKRSERQFVDASTVALSGLLGGVLGIAAPGTAALAYLPLAFSFSQNVYSAYQTAILLGLESSTVKSIVNERRHQHRLKFNSVKYEDRPSAIYAMREYLMICTPQTIVQDVNTYSRRAVTTGGNIAAEDAARTASAAPTANQSAGGGGERDLEASKYPERFPIPSFDDDDLAAWQTANCIRPTVANIGPQTLTSIAIFEATDDRAVADGKIRDDDTNKEYTRATVMPTCDEAYRNYFEKITYQDNTGAELTLVNNLFNAAFGAVTADTSTPPVSINDARVRARIKEVRTSLTFQELTGIETDLSEQMTPALLAAMNARLEQNN